MPAPIRALLAAALLAMAALPARAQPAACPPNPVDVVRSRGGTNRYVGTYPAIPDLCRMVRADGPGDYYYGVWRTDWPGAGDAYPAIKTVVLGQPGDRIDFITRSIPGLQWIDSFINEGIETMLVDGTTYRVLRLAHERKGIEGNTYHSIITSWRDVRTGINLRTFEYQIAGQSYGPDTTWQATRVTHPAPLSSTTPAATPPKAAGSR